MVRPVSFDYNPETAASNKMQRPEGYPVESGTAAATATSPTLAAQEEFDRLVAALRSEGVSVCVAADTPQPPKPDAVFPNNWVSFHEDGTVVLYPMQAQNRRRERRREIVDTVVEQIGFKMSRLVDLTHHETQGRYLEGTGSLILDHVQRVAYASISSRTHPEVVQEWAQELKYEPVVFETADRSGSPLYHTNVLLCIGQQAVILGSAAIPEKQRGAVLERLRASGREIVEIGQQEVAHFAGNVLEVASWDEALGDFRIMVMSETARRALSPDSFARLSASTDTVLAVPVPTIERLGGGSVRCMLAEVFLPA